MPLISGIIGIATEDDKTFEVEGIVTDENGNGIDGVFLSIDEATPSFSGTTTSNRRSSYEKNVKTFKVQSKGYTGLALHFTRIGYERQQLNFTKSGRYKNIHVILKKEPS